MAARFTRSDLIRTVSDNTDLTRAEAEHVVHLMQDAFTRALAQGQRVSLNDFGSLTPSIIEPRMVRNPSTGKQMEAARTARVYFRPSPTLKGYISGSKELPEDTLVTDLRRDS